MKIVRTISEVREARAGLGRVAFVPTMGALHVGHTSLMRTGLEHAESLVVSIFVNPTQFDRPADLESYPRDESRDLAACREAGVSLVFVPTVDEMYPDGPASARTEVRVDGLTDNLCGRTRPGHFDGVTTVVSKLFHIVQPDVAVFGQKDYQQLTIIGRMTRDLNFPVEIVGAPTAREVDGLAVSSRNLNLDAAGRRAGLALSRGLGEAKSAFEGGISKAPVLEQIVREELEQAGLRVDYVECVHPDTLERLLRVGEEGARLACAAFAGDVRLIDNVALEPDGAQR